MNGLLFNNCRGWFSPLIGPSERSLWCHYGGTIPSANLIESQQVSIDYFFAIYDHSHQDNLVARLRNIDYHVHDFRWITNSVKQKRTLNLDEYNFDELDKRREEQEEQRRIQEKKRQKDHRPINPSRLSQVTHFTSTDPSSDNSPQQNTSSNSSQELQSRLRPQDQLSPANLVHHNSPEQPHLASPPQSQSPIQPIHSSQLSKVGQFSSQSTDPSYLERRANFEEWEKQKTELREDPERWDERNHFSRSRTGTEEEHQVSEKGEEEEEQENWSDQCVQSDEEEEQEEQPEVGHAGDDSGYHDHLLNSLKRPITTDLDDPPSPSPPKRSRITSVTPPAPVPAPSPPIPTNTQKRKSTITTPFPSPILSAFSRPRIPLTLPLPTSISRSDPLPLPTPRPLSPLRKIKSEQDLSPRASVIVQTPFRPLSLFRARAANPRALERADPHRYPVRPRRSIHSWLHFSFDPLLPMIQNHLRNSILKRY
ncbi:hypothetical protein P7C70_g7873, partial [Phenoliferia sp. Uapishka_3]